MSQQPDELDDIREFLRINFTQFLEADPTSVTVASPELVASYAMNKLLAWRDKAVADFIASDDYHGLIEKLILEASVKSVQELRRRWDEDRKTMDYSPDTYLYICDKYLNELKAKLGGKS